MIHRHNAVSRFVPLTSLAVASPSYELAHRRAALTSVGSPDLTHHRPRRTAARYCIVGHRSSIYRGWLASSAQYILVVFPLRSLAPVKTANFFRLARRRHGRDYSADLIRA